MLPRSRFASLWSGASRLDDDLFLSLHSRLASTTVEFASTGAATVTLDCRMFMKTYCG
jgi:hypothetical protein